MIAPPPAETEANEDDEKNEEENEEKENENENEGEDDDEDESDEEDFNPDAEEEEDDDEDGYRAVAAFAPGQKVDVDGKRLVLLESAHRARDVQRRRSLQRDVRLRLRL